MLLKATYLGEELLLQEDALNIFWDMESCAREDAVPGLHRLWHCLPGNIAFEQHGSVLVTDTKSRMWSGLAVGIEMTTSSVWMCYCDVPPAPTYHKGSEAMHP